MKKIKIMTLNPTQWANALKKAQAWGAFSRDGDVAFNAAKTAMVIVMDKDPRGPFIQSSRTDFAPSKNPYTHVYKYGDWMSLASAPWDVRPATLGGTASKSTPPSPSASVREVVKHVPTYIEVPVAAPSVCAQSTLTVKTCSVSAQNPIIFATVGLPYLVELGMDVQEHGDKFYVLDTVKNTSTEVTPESVADLAKKDIEAGKVDTIYAKYAYHFDLIDAVSMKKVVEDAED